MSEVTKIELLVRNRVYVLTDEYVHLGNDGLGLPPVRRLEEAGPLQDGVSDVGHRLGPRTVKLLFLLSADSPPDYYQKRRRLFQQFRPRDAATQLRFTLPDGSVRQLDVVYDGELTLPSNDKTGLLHKVAVSLRAANPTFYDPAGTAVNFQIAVNSSSFAVPLTVPVGVGTSVLDQTTQIAYEGDWKASPLITIIGPVTSLKVENLTTGEMLSFPGLIINAGERLVVDTSYGGASVVDGDGVSKLSALSDDSDLTTFHLAPDPDAFDGVNDVRVTGTAATTQTAVYLSYNARYLGI